MVAAGTRTEGATRQQHESIERNVKLSVTEELSNLRLSVPHGELSLRVEVNEGTSSELPDDGVPSGIVDALASTL